MISVGASHVILFDKQKKDICYQLELGKKLSRFSEHLISGFHGDMYMEIGCPIGGQWSAKCEVSGYHGYRSSVSDGKSLVRIVFDLLSVDCMFPLYSTMPLIRTCLLQPYGFPKYNCATS